MLEIDHAQRLGPFAVQHVLDLRRRVLNCVNTRVSSGRVIRLAEEIADHPGKLFDVAAAAILEHELEAARRCRYRGSAAD